jgi:hypothetical protein
MEKKIKTTEVEVHDHYGDECLGDSINRGMSSERRPAGEVHVYEIDDNGKRKLVQKSNLVVYNGREVLAQMLVRANNSLMDPINNATTLDAKDHFLSWFGLGNGGVVPADPLDPVPPVLTNTNLNSEIMISATDSSNADYHLLSESGYSKSGYYKHPFDQIEFERDPLNDDKYIILKVTVTIGVNDANEEQISEAGLFTAASDVGGWAGPFYLFARVTFSSIVKTTDRRLVFVWYLYV